MTDPHRPRLLREAIGRKAKTRRTIMTREMLVPDGTVVVIGPSTVWSDLHVTAPPCPHCGVAVRIRKVDPNDLEFLPTTA